MTPTTTFGFVRTLLLPGILLFVLPVFGLWFAGHAERSYGSGFLAQVLPQIDADASIRSC